jgi:hypothetical protein
MAMGKAKRRVGRPKRHEWLEIARKAVRQHDNLHWALMLFGPRVCAEEVIRRHKVDCKRAGRRYSRDYAIDEAAKLVGMDRNTLANWLNRSKQTSPR